MKMKTTRDLIIDALTVQPSPITFDQLVSAVNMVGPTKSRNAVQKSLKRLVAFNRVHVSGQGFSLTSGARAESAPTNHTDATT